MFVTQDRQQRCLKHVCAVVLAAATLTPAASWAQTLQRGHSETAAAPGAASHCTAAAETGQQSGQNDYCCQRKNSSRRRECAAVAVGPCCHTNLNAMRLMPKLKGGALSLLTMKCTSAIFDLMGGTAVLIRETLAGILGGVETFVKCVFIAWERQADSSFACRSWKMTVLLTEGFGVCGVSSLSSSAELPCLSCCHKGHRLATAAVVVTWHPLLPHTLCNCTLNFSSTSLCRYASQLHSFANNSINNICTHS